MPRHVSEELSNEDLVILAKGEVDYYLCLLQDQRFDAAERCRYTLLSYLGALRTRTRKAARKANPQG